VGLRGCSGEDICKTAMGKKRGRGLDGRQTLCRVVLERKGGMREGGSLWIRRGVVLALRGRIEQTLRKGEWGGLFAHELGRSRPRQRGCATSLDPANNFWRTKVLAKSKNRSLCTRIRDRAMLGGLRSER